MEHAVDIEPLRDQYRDALAWAAHCYVQMKKHPTVKGSANQTKRGPWFEMWRDTQANIVKLADALRKSGITDLDPDRELAELLSA